MLKELLYFSNLPPLFILVIMEDMLRAGSSSRSEVSNSVLILVLMEDTLRGGYPLDLKKAIIGS